MLTLSSPALLLPLLIYMLHDSLEEALNFPRKKQISHLKFSTSIFSTPHLSFQAFDLTRVPMT